MMGLPKNISNADVDRLEKSMAALANRGAALPKGPLPAGAKMRNVARTLRRR
jgi:cob(I)alamin adenosyltransferase